jgi:hypothetical protein
MSSKSSNWQRRVIQSTISSFSINFCLSTLSYNQTSRLNEPATLFRHRKKATNNKLIETMMLLNLVNIISKPTRITTRSNSLLDPIIISDTMNYIYSDVLKIPSEISDHDASVGKLLLRVVILVGLLIIFTKLSNIIVSINLLLLAINKSEFKSHQKGS